MKKYYHKLWLNYHLLIIGNGLWGYGKLAHHVNRADYHEKRSLLRGLNG